MTEVKAQFKYLRGSAPKMRRAVNLVRGKRCSEALALLRFVPSKAAGIVAKLIKSAMANAKHNYKLEEKSLRVQRIFADSAFIIKRMRPRARGRGFSIKKRLSHVTVFVGPKEESSGTKG